MPDLVAEIRKVLDVAEKSLEESSYFCNKCGFYGKDAVPPGTHPNCNYLAVRVPNGWEIYNALEPIREMLRDE